MTTGSARTVGEKLCVAAARGSLNRLTSYRLAGANLSQPDLSGRTALHTACLHGHKEIVVYLLNNYVDKDTKDLIDLTPIDYAARSGQKEIMDLLIENGVQPTKNSELICPIESTNDIFND